ncbi:hypothetical protein ACJIZ3_018307 [Penstemon smallii]|uniref:Uncharacterized protein n=1 Tax=Penstemon smallii TaxID=265156 RepID=A0ABD3SY23_9LAMI
MSFTSAPAKTSKRNASTWPSFAAIITAEKPFSSCLFRSISPCPIRVFNARTSPDRATNNKEWHGGEEFFPDEECWERGVGGAFVR